MRSATTTRGGRCLPPSWICAAPRRRRRCCCCWAACWASRSSWRRRRPWRSMPLRRACRPHSSHLLPIAHRSPSTAWPAAQRTSGCPQQPQRSMRGRRSAQRSAGSLNAACKVLLRMTRMMRKAISQARLLWQVDASCAAQLKSVVALQRSGQLHSLDLAAMEAALDAQDATLRIMCQARGHQPGKPGARTRCQNPVPCAGTPAGKTRCHGVLPSLKKGGGGSSQPRSQAACPLLPRSAAPRRGEKRS